MRFLRRQAGDQGRGADGRPLRGRRPGPAFVPAGAYGEIAPGEIRRVAGLPVVLCRSGDRVYAVSWVCPHGAAKLAKGRLVDDCLECPLHGARFALESGQVRRGPARRGLLSYEVQIFEGEVFVSRQPRRIKGFAGFVEAVRASRSVRGRGLHTRGRGSRKAGQC